MKKIEFESTQETPAVILNPQEGFFSFKGKSLPENVNEFYATAIDVLTNYVQSPRDKTTLEFNWIYFNTSTSKMIVKIIILLKAVVEKKKLFTINWYCRADDDLMIDKGEEFKELLLVDFNIIHI